MLSIWWKDLFGISETLRVEEFLAYNLKTSQFYFFFMVSLFIGIPVFKISLESLLTKGDSDVQYIKAKSSALWIKLAMFLLQLSSTHWREEVIAGWAIIPKHPDRACYPCTSHCCFPILSVMKTNWCDYYFVQDLKPLTRPYFLAFLVYQHWYLIFTLLDHCLFSEIDPCPILSIHSYSHTLQIFGPTLGKINNTCRQLWQRIYRSILQLFQNAQLYQSHQPYPVSQILHSCSVCECRSVCSSDWESCRIDFFLLLAMLVHRDTKFWR